MLKGLTEMDLTKYNDLDVVLVCGLPGSGKSHFSKAYFGKSDRHRINRKEIRRLLYEMTHFGEPWSEDYYTESDEYLVKHVERRILEHLLHHKHKVLIDNTSVTAASRRTYVNMAGQMKKSIGVILLNVPLLKCINRNHKRPEPIPSTAISNLSAAIDKPNRDEGFKHILVIENY